MRNLYLFLPLLLLPLLPACERGAQSPPADATPSETAPEPPARSEAGEIERTAAVQPTDTASDGGDYAETEWDALIPAGWQPDQILSEYNVDEFEDDDPRAKELIAKLEAVWKESPVVPELDGRRVKMPGFVVPIETDSERIAEFLLVPYYGACIHVPPPPTNQTVYVVTGEGAEYRGQLFDTVWVTGTIKVESSSSELADAGYRIDAVKVEPYDG